jgi:hypothetical protein
MTDKWRCTVDIAELEDPRPAAQGGRANPVFHTHRDRCNRSRGINESGNHQRLVSRLSSVAKAEQLRMSDSDQHLDTAKTSDLGFII